VTRPSVKFGRRISQKPFTVLDFGRDVVLALTVERAPGGLRLLGGGEAAPRGVKEGRVEHLGDAVEAVVEVLKKAEQNSGARAETVYFNFDDPGMESAHPAASKTLKGEGEISAEDVRDAAETAERQISHFERRIVYARETGFLIDDKDAVADPVGVFGRKLDVFTHVLSAPPERWEAWQKVFERALVPKAIPVLSAWSTAYGVFPEGDRDTKRLVLDLGRDLLNIFLYRNNMITEYKVVPVAGKDVPAAVELAVSAASALLKRDPEVIEAVVTGDWAADKVFISHLHEALPVPLRTVSPAGYPKLEHPRYASAVGLLAVAKELEGKAPLLSREKGLLTGLKEKAVSLLNEYF